MKIKDFYDIVIVGSGPAGGMTALSAAKNGASVLILERHREVGIPVRCAEGISLQGLIRFFELDDKWISNYIEGAKLYAPNGESCIMIASTIGKGVVLERRLFDAYICKLAVKYGAEILTKSYVFELIKKAGKICGVKFKYFNEEKQVKTNLVIAADGPESRIGRLANLNTSLKLSDIESSAQYLLTNIKVEQQYCHFYFSNNMAPGGYLWVFPKGKNEANIGIGVQADRCKGKNAKKLLDEFIEKEFSDGKIISFIAGCVPIATTLKKITADNIMLVGDSARQINPVTGGGLSSVLVAGNIAGEVASKAVQKNDFSDKFLKKYNKKWMKEKGYDQKVMYKLKEVFFDFDDEKLNEIVKIINAIPKEKLTLFQLFKIAVREHPSLVKELIKIYI